jgi:hypothetical protein
MVPMRAAGKPATALAARPFRIGNQPKPPFAPVRLNVAFSECDEVNG